MPKSTYKSNYELKNLARMQTSHYLGILIISELLNLVLSYLIIDAVSSIVPANGTTGYILNYIVVFIAQILVSVLDIGVIFIYMKSACNMKSRIRDLFFGYQHHFTRALKVGFILVVIHSICTIPLEIATSQFADILDNNAFFNNMINGSSVYTSEMLESYGVLTSSMMKYYIIMFVCSLVSSLLTLPFFPANYMLLDFPNQNVTQILKKCFEVMHGNIFRLIGMYISFVPLLLLSLLTCGIAFVWVIPYMKMTAANFYLDLMTVRNRTM